MHFGFVKHNSSLEMFTPVARSWDSTKNTAVISSFKDVKHTHRGLMWLHNFDNSVLFWINLDNGKLILGIADFHQSPICCIWAFWSVELIIDKDIKENCGLILYIKIPHKTHYCVCFIYTKRLSTSIINFYFKDRE